MSVYEAFKDVIKLAQKADNIELYRQLIDLSAQALDMQEEIARLKEENSQLKKGKDIEGKIIRHKQPFVTLLGEENPIKYCATCWDYEQKLVQMQSGNWNGCYK